MSASLNAASDPVVNYLQELEQEKSATNIYRAFFPNLDIARKAAISFHNQLLASSLDEGYLILELTADEMEALKQFVAG